jgi:hypothetical protein
MGYAAGEHSARGLHAVPESVPDDSLRECFAIFWPSPTTLIGIYSQLGLYFMDPKEALQHFTQEERDTLPEKWLNAAHGVRADTLTVDFCSSHADCKECLQSLWQSDFMAVHTIEHLQTMTLMGIFLNTRDRADAAWSMLGAAIKVRGSRGVASSC